MGRTDGSEVDALRILERDRGFPNDDKGAVRVIGDGGHAKVIRDMPILTNDAYTFIAIGDNATRKRIALEHEGMRPAALFGFLIHPSAQVSTSARIGPGTVVMAYAIIAADAVVGKHCIINHGATVDHDCIIGDYAHIAPGAHLCGNVEVGEGALVGVGVGVPPCTKIPAWSLVKAARLDIVPREQDYGEIAGRG